MATVVSIVGTFVLNGRLVGQLGVDVPGVPPSTVGGLPSITGAVICGDGHVCNQAAATQFGIPTARVVFRQSVGGVGSAQVFGVVTRITGGVSSSASGVPSAQAFGTPTLKAVFRAPVNGVPSAQVFGALTFRTGRTQPVTGIASAQAFGNARPTITAQVAGVASAQSFGVFHLVYRQFAPVAGIGSAQAFGTAQFGFVVYNVWLHLFHCIQTPYMPVCGDPICGDGHVCGGYSFIFQSGECLTSPFPTILDEFLCGQAVIGGPPYMTEEPDPIVLDLQPVGCS